MYITLVSGKHLTPDQYRVWSYLQEADSAFDSPFFCPEFTAAVASVREGVNVGVIGDNGRTVGFFPFQRGRFGFGTPVGGPLSDCQGVVVQKDLTWKADDLIRECQLSMWDFDHLIKSPSQRFESYHSRTADAPFMDLSEGFDLYRQRRNQERSKLFKRLDALSRKLEREIGPIRFECHVRDPAVLSTLFLWKSEQYRASGGVDILRSTKWTRTLLEHIHQMQSPAFSGLLSALYAGDHVIAAHMGMRSRCVWHYWIPAYDRQLAQYSPGLILLYRMAQAASSFGMKRIDLGKGGEHYKQRFMSGVRPLANGSVSIRCSATAMRKACGGAARWLGGTSLGNSLRVPGRKVLRLCRELLF